MKSLKLATGIVAVSTFVVLWHEEDNNHQEDPFSASEQRLSIASTAKIPTQAKHLDISKKTEEKTSISLLEKSRLTPEHLFSASTGRGKEAIGVGNEQQDPRGPMAFAVNSSGRIAVVDGINRRLQFRDAHGRVLHNEILSEDSILRHVAVDENENFVLLETENSGQVFLKTYNDLGQYQERIQIQTQDDFVKYGVNAFKVDISSNGITYLVGLEESHRILENGRLQKIPGIPFKNDNTKFITLSADSAGNRSLNIVDTKGTVLNSFGLENKYTSVSSIQSDAQNQIYVQYDTIIESAPLSPGAKSVQSRMGVIESYSANGDMTGWLSADLSGFYEIDHAFALDPKSGDFIAGKAERKEVRFSRIPLVNQ